MTPAPADSAVEELPDGLLRAGYRHRAAPDLSQLPNGLFRGRLALIRFAEAFACEEEDLGVFHQAIGDGGSNGGVVEDVAPVGDLSGHPKTGQRWSGQNRPTGGGRGLSCFILPAPVVASLFSYANSGDHI